MGLMVLVPLVGGPARNGALLRSKNLLGRVHCIPGVIPGIPVTRSGVKGYALATLRAGCVMYGTVGRIQHCHWPSRTIYGTSRRVTGCWA
jgi:hypothetical protein